MRIAMKIFLLFFTLFFSRASLSAQSCLVINDSLKGEYSGGCLKGKADGKGVAKGSDSYTGNFKKGYPDGKGKYVWKNGDSYEGSWKEGLFDGEGVLHKKDDNRDSAVTISGFWKKGKYIGKNEKPYTISALTNSVSSLNIRDQKAGQPDITIVVKSITGGANSVGTYTTLPKCKLTDIQLIRGRFDQQVADEQSSPVSNKYFLRHVTYPFTAILTFETVGVDRLHKEKVSVEITESSNWYIQVEIDN
jgi:hypothetical protein